MGIQAIAVKAIKTNHVFLDLEQSLYLNEYDELCRLDLGNTRNSQSILVLL